MAAFSVELKANNTILDVDLNKPTTAFVLVIILCVIVFPIAVISFSLLRPKLKRIYAPRLLLLEEKLCPLGKLPSSLFAWISPAYMLSDDDLFNYVGMDALVFMRFLRLCLKLSLFTMPFGLILLLPLNLHGANHLTDALDKMSVSNIKGMSAKMWAHWVCVWIYTAAAMHLLYEEWKVYVLYRQAYLSKGKGKQYVTLLYDLDNEKLSDEALRIYAENLFPSKVSGTYLVKDLKYWDQLIKEHDSLVRKLEYARAKSEIVATESQKLVDETGKINKYEKKLQILQVRMEEEQSSEHKPVPAAIVVFNSVSTRMISVHTPWDIEVFHNKSQPGPEPSEIVWKNLALTPFKRKLRYGLGEALVAFVFLMWSPVVAFISSLKNLKALAKQLKFLEDAVDAMPSLLVAVLQGIAPAILLICLYLILPWMLRIIARYQGLFSKSLIEKKVFRDLALFNIFNTFFVFVLSSSLFGVLYNILSIVESPSDLPVLFATSLPKQANFYINYIALSTFCLHGLELTRFGPLLSYFIKSKWCAKTTRTKREAWKPGPPHYSDLLANGLLMFLVGMSYSVLSPLIVPFVVLYFGFGYVVYAYQLVHVYVPEYDMGGELWPMTFSRLITGLVVFQLLMVGVLLLKGLFVAGGSLFLLPILTVAYWYWTGKYFNPLGKFLSRRSASGLKIPETEFLKGVRDSYIRNSAVPGLYNASTDAKKPAFEYEYYVPTRADSDQEMEGYNTT